MPRRLQLLPHAVVSPPALDVRVAATLRTRLLGLLGLASVPRGVALLLRGTRSVHTCGMRFALDLLWLDARGRVLRVDEQVRPWRLRTCRRAHSVVEVSAGTARALSVAELRFRFP
jgi:uncharacterized membrane protein (UPF0127 family)